MLDFLIFLISFKLFKIFIFLLFDNFLIVIKYILNDMVKFLICFKIFYFIYYYFILLLIVRNFMQLI